MNRVDSGRTLSLTTQPLAATVKAVRDVLQTLIFKVLWILSQGENRDNHFLYNRVMFHLHDCGMKRDALLLCVEQSERAQKKVYIQIARWNEAIICGEATYPSISLNFQHDLYKSIQSKTVETNALHMYIHFFFLT